MEIDLLTELFLPFPLTTNDRMAGTDQRILDWVADMGCEKGSEDWMHAEKIQSSLMSAAAFPSASPERFDVVAKWVAWILLVDSVIDEGSHDLREVDSYLKSLLVLFEKLELPENPDIYHHMLLDIAKSCHKLGNQQWIKKFLLSMEHFHEGIKTEVRIRLQQDVPSVDKYIKLRTLTAGMYQAFDLIEFSNDAYLPLGVAYDPKFQEMRTLAVQITAWGNDLCSYQKEMEYNEITNLLNILKANRKVSLIESLKQAVIIHNDSVSRYLALEKELHKDYQDKSLELYCEGLRGWMKGALEWGLSSARYRDSQNKINLSEFNLKHLDFFASNDL